MPRRSLILAAVLMLAACGSSAAGPSSGSSSAGPQCGPASAHTIAHSRLARVYSLGRSVYGCVDPSGKAYRLGANNACLGTQSVTPVMAVVKQLAGYGLETCGIDTGFANTVVRRLTDGKQLHSDAAVTGPLGPESHESLGSLVLKADGADAWIAIGQSILAHGSPRIEVHLHDSSGARLLDSGSAIDPRSLRLKGSVLTWKHGSQTRSTTLR